MAINSIKTYIHTHLYMWEGVECLKIKLRERR